MAVERQSQVSNRRRLRAARRRVIAVVPAVVWLLTIVVALQLYQRPGAVPTMRGHAEDAPVRLAHFEPGVVRGVHVELYEQVTRGQVLLTMDDREERNQLAAIERDVARLSAEITAERARLQADNARATAYYVDLVRRFAIDREAAHIDYLAQLVEDVRDRILLRGSLVEYDIVPTLYDEGQAALRELNDIETQADALEATIKENVAVIARKKEAFEESDRRWIQYVEHESVEMSYDPVLTPLRLAVDVRERDLEEVVRRIDAHVLRSPIEGQVTGLLAHAGDNVGADPTLPLVTISPTSTNLVVAYLPERTALAAEVGTPVSVRCLATAAGRRRQYPGTVVSVSATVTEAPPRYRPTPTYPVWNRGLVVALNNGVRLIPGEAVTIALLNQH